MPTPPPRIQVCRGLRGLALFRGLLLIAYHQYGGQDEGAHDDDDTNHRVLHDGHQGHGVDAVVAGTFGAHGGEVVEQAIGYI